MKSFNLDQNNQLVTLDNMECCLTNVESWMSSNMLKLNDGKTEVMVIAAAARLRKCQLNHIKIGQSNIPFSPVVKNLGVYIDSNLSMEHQINHLCRICHFHLRNIGAIRYLLIKEATACLVRSLVLSRLDYCNSLLIGVSSDHLQRLQKIQNRAARMITRTKLHSHITPILKSLHWLRVRERIDFKVLSLAYQCAHKMGPAYLQDLVSCYRPPRTLRSTDQFLLNIPTFKLKSFGARSFRYVAAFLWNSLPLSLKSAPSLAAFKSQLKTYLFARYR